MKIRDLTPYSKNIHLKFMVIENLGSLQTKDEKIVRTYLVADNTGSIEYSIFDQELNIGDIIKIKFGYVTFFKGKNRLLNSEITKIRRIGEFCMEFKREPNKSEEN